MFEDYLEAPKINSEFRPFQIGNNMSMYRNFEDFDKAKVALLAVPDGRASNMNVGCGNGTDQILQELYELSSNLNSEECINLGKIKPGARFEDTARAVHEVCKDLISHQVIPIVIGGSSELLFPLYQSLEGVSNNIDITHVSAQLALDEGDILQKVCSYEPHYLFNMNLLGFQGHYVPDQTFDVLNNMGFEHLRLGSLKKNVEDAEPLIRNTNMFTFDIGGVKKPDAPANYYANPIGLDGDIACQLCWYAGLSDTTNAFGIFEMNPEFDDRNQTAKLVAQMIWYFLEGVKLRKNDHPNLHEEFLRYRCNLNNKYPDIVFHKSKRTNRWWMEMPHPKSLNNKEMNVLIPCSYSDYQQSAKGDLPERYLRAIQKMH